MNTGLEGCTVSHFPRQERLMGSTGVRGERESSIVCVFTLPGVISAPQDHLITGGICGWTHAASHGHARQGWLATARLLRKFHAIK